MKRVAFDDLPWQTSASGVRFKVQRLGVRQLRLLEFTRELDHPHWCETGHVGFVLEGTMEVGFAEGAAVTFHAGDGVCIPAGWTDRHRPTALSERVRLIFVEEDFSMKSVIFACIHNAGRSQMAAAWFNALADATKARAVSAGTEPGARVHPEVLEAMREVGIDLADRKPQKLTDDLARGAQMLVTMGCGEQCPVVPGLKRDDWPLEDPKGKPIERVREIRDDVRRRVAELLRAEGWAKA
jgi:arsenate reductase (thioredoxin)